MVECEVDNLSNGIEYVMLSLRGWKFGELKCEYYAEGSIDFVVFGTGNFRRSLFVGCEFD